MDYNDGFITLQQEIFFPKVNATCTHTDTHNGIYVCNVGRISSAGVYLTEDNK